MREQLFETYYYSLIEIYNCLINLIDEILSANSVL